MEIVSSSSSSPLHLSCQVKISSPSSSILHSFPQWNEDEKKEDSLCTALDYSSLQVLPSPYKPSLPDCTQCGRAIEDRHLLSVGGRRWHTSCLSCTLCSSSLHDNTSCYEKEGLLYCRNCYHSQFGTKCSGCSRHISSTDWVRRARRNVYHIACFGCNQCKRQLSTGEEFSLQDNRLLCMQHYMELVEGDTAQTRQKAKRVRTTFADEQLSILQAHFQIDSNPDGADLEKIAQSTGLSKRVTQVWFQNSRARQKKYQGTRKAAPGTSVAANDGRKNDSSEDATSPISSCSMDDGILYSSERINGQDSLLHSYQKGGLQPLHYD